MGRDAGAVLRGVVMTKAELIRALEGLPDDADIYVPSTKVSNAWVHASYVMVDYGGIDGCRADALVVGTDMRYKQGDCNQE